MCGLGGMQAQAGGRYFGVKGWGSGRSGIGNIGVLGSFRMGVLRRTSNGTGPRCELLRDEATPVLVGGQIARSEIGLVLEKSSSSVTG